MTILYALEQGGHRWIPIMHGPQISTLILLAQLMEANGLSTMFQMGVDYALFATESVEPSPDWPMGV
jgi:hypothetical protein